MTYKKGRGNKDNSSYWACVFDDEKNLYYGETYLGNADGIIYNLYKINKEIFDKVGTFDRDDYKSQDLIKSGELLYSLEDLNFNDGPIEEILDSNYKQIHDIYFKDTVK